MTYHIFIGLDERQKEAFAIAKYSLEKHATVPIKVHKLDHRELRQQGLFTRPWEIQADGQYLCKVDNRPFSTQFSHTRFLVPELWRRLNDQGKSNLVLFMDCDMLVLSDIKEVFASCETQRLIHNYCYPLYCVHHNYKPSTETKMEGFKQYAYNRKLHSSFMVFDMDSDDNANLTPDVVNTEDGRNLHNFNWVVDQNRIGKIDESFNFIPDHSEKNVSKINNIHFTEAGPWLGTHRNCKYGNLWLNTYGSYLCEKIERVSFDVARILDNE